MKQSKLLHSVPDAADALGVDAKTVRSKLQKGEIPGERYGRVWKIPDWWIRQHREGPKVA